MKSLKSYLTLMLVLALSMCLSAQESKKSKLFQLTDVSGNALAFDGKSDVVNLGNSSSVRLTQGTVDNFSKTGTAPNFVKSTVFAKESVDSTQIRYIKFSTTVDDTIPQIGINEIKVFADGENIAYNKSVSSNSANTDTQTSKIVDNDNSTTWLSDTYNQLTSDGGYGPTLNHPHYIIVNLGAAYNLESLKLDINGGGTWSFNYTFDFLVSPDGTNWSLVDHKDNTHGVYTYTNIPIQNVRYIKYNCFYSSDRGQVNVEEIQAYYNGVNIALNKSVTTSTGWGGSSAVDGNSSSRWSSDRNDHVVDNRPASANVSTTIDLGCTQTVDSIALSYNNHSIFTISTSTDGNNWTIIDERLNETNYYQYTLNRLPKVSYTIDSFGVSTTKCNVDVSSDGGTPVIERGVCWSTSADPTIDDNKISSGTGTGSFPVTIADLVKNTVYYIRAYAINSSGIKYSKTQTILFGLTIESDVVTFLNSTSAVSGGSVFAGNGIDVIEKGVCWSTTPLPTIDNNYTTDGAGTGEFTTTLTNLTGDTKYYVRAYATTSSGTFYGAEYSYIGAATKYVSNWDGYYGGNTFTETGTYNGYPLYTSEYGATLFYDGTWYIDGWISSEESGNPPLTGWWDGTVLEKIETPVPSVTFSKDTLKESSFYDGSIRDTLTITHDNLNGATFAGTDNEDFVLTGKAVVRNLPLGLTASIIRSSSLTLTVSIKGCATEHANTNDIGNVKIMLTPGAFSNGNTITTKGNLTRIAINFIDAVDLHVTGTKSCAEVGMTAENNVIVEDSAVLNIGAQREMNQLILKPGSKLNVSSNSVKVNNIILKADDCNSFCASMSSGVTVNGSVIFEKTMLDSKQYLLSFPCDVNVSEITMNGGGVVDEDFYILNFDGAAKASNGDTNNWSHVTSGTLSANKGYAFSLKANSGTKTLSFVLDKNITQCETSTSVPATFYDGNLGNNHKGWNLIGQPYMSKFAGSYVGIPYLTTWDGNSYVGQTKNRVNCIHPFEAFLVQVDNTSSISFSAEGRQSVRSVVELLPKETIQLNMTNSTGSDFSSIILSDANSTEYEIGQDLEKWVTTTSTKPQIYSLMNGVKYAYNALPEDNFVNMPIGYYCKDASECTISASNVNVSGLSKLLLLDIETGYSTDLLSESYTFNTASGTNNARFTITPQRLSTIDLANEMATGPVVFVRDSKITLRNLENNSTIRLYDATGKILYSSKLNHEDIHEIQLQSSGLYIVRVDSNKNSLTYKIINK